MHKQSSPLKWRRKHGKYRIRIYFAYGIKQAELQKRVFPFFWVIFRHVYISPLVNTHIVFRWIEIYDIPQCQIKDETMAFEPSTLLKELYEIYN